MVIPSTEETVCLDNALAFIGTLAAAIGTFAIREAGLGAFIYGITAIATLLASCHRICDIRTLGSTSCFRKPSVQVLLGADAHGPVQFPQYP